MRSEQLRFDVELEGRRPRLVLTAPARARHLSVRQLVVALEPLEGPVDLRAGYRAFRHRRGSVLRAVVAVDLRSLARAVARAGVRVDAMRARNGALEVEARDGFGLISGVLRFSARGRDLRVVPIGLVGSGDATHPPAQRFVAALPPLPDLHIADEGLLVRDPISWALREVFLPEGFRAPRAVAGALRPTLEEGALVLSLAADDAPRRGPRAGVAAMADRISTPSEDET